jgi:hypothetical protein
MIRLGITKSRWWRRQTLNKTNWLNRKREAVPIVQFFVALEQQKEEKSVVSTSYRLLRLNEDVTIWSKKWFFLMEQLKLQILKHSSFNGAATGRDVGFSHICANEEYHSQTGSTNRPENMGKHGHSLR